MPGVLDKFFALPAPIIGLVTFALLIAMMLLGDAVRRRYHKNRAVEAVDDAKESDGYIVSGTLGLMALLLGFTFALAIDRFDSRRTLVLEEANAIGTTYLRAQLLDEPDRSQLSQLLESYTRNRIALAQSGADGRDALMAQSDALQARLWTATVTAIRPIRGLEVSSTFVDTMNATIDAGAARVASRRAHVPTRVVAVLLLYMAISAFVLGHVISSGGRRTATVIQLLLVTIAYTLILDIDQPNSGGIRESQAPMVDLLTMMHDNPPHSFGTVVGAQAPAPQPDHTPR